VPRRNLWLAAVLVLMAVVVLPAATIVSAEDAAKHVDPRAWGKDFAGQPVPQTAEGGQCLFCHRGNLASNWTTDRHNTTMRSIEDAVDAKAAIKDKGAAAGEATWVLGHERALRFLKPSADYGKADMLNLRFDPKSHTFAPDADAKWDGKTFGESCAGCHATGFDNKSSTFFAQALDCFMCHGDVPLEHTKDTTRVLLSKNNGPTPEVVVSLCGSCHIRTGKSRSTGRPFANNFVAGDNLFRDMDVDTSDTAIAKLNPIDRHVLENVRDVAASGRKDVTCLTCHAVHLGTSLRHRKLKDEATCFTCHKGTDTRSGVKDLAVTSELCGY
jgi:hypothetical protein